MMDDNDDMLTAVKRMEWVISEEDVGFSPNPKLTELKCMFKHKHCKADPSYTDGENNYYCHTHAIMIQWKKFQ
jgi:hypothetical protein